MIFNIDTTAIYELVQYAGPLIDVQALYETKLGCLVAAAIQETSGIASFRCEAWA